MAQLHAATDAELASLAAEFDRMLARLRESFDRLYQFTADAAHEFRTPLNNLLGGTSLALARPRTSEDYHSILEFQTRPNRSPIR